MSRPWSTEENEATAAIYFQMLRLEHARQRFNKSDFYRRLHSRLDGRSLKAGERKLQNISAVLANNNQPYLKGLLPAQNYQRALESAVLEWIVGRSDLVEALDEGTIVNPPSPTAIPRYSDIVTSPPEPKRAARPGRLVAPVRIDFVSRDIQNRALGAAGEEFVVELERRRLHDEERRPDLARKVRWASRDEGDGLGYDIGSYESDGVPRLIEVKTTGNGWYFPFALTRNELACSKRIPNEYRLYRVYDFGPAPRLYVLSGALDEVCTLAPTLYQATPRG